MLVRLPLLFLEISTEVLILLAIFGLPTLDYSVGFVLFAYTVALLFDTVGLSLVKNEYIEKGFKLTIFLPLVLVLATLLIYFIELDIDAAKLIFTVSGLAIVKFITNMFSNNNGDSVTHYKVKGLQFLSLFAVGMFGLGTSMSALLGHTISTLFLVFVVISFILIDTLFWRCDSVRSEKNNCYRKIVLVSGTFVLILFACGAIAMVYGDMTGQYPTGNFIQALKNINS